MQIIGPLVCMFPATNHPENDLQLPASFAIVAEIDATLEDPWPSPSP
jgi:hypothetical protein